MRSLSDSEVLDLVDAGRLLSAEARVLNILRIVSGESDETLAQLPRARLDALLIDARALTIGPRLEACIACGECGTLLEATVDCRELLADPPDAFELSCDNCGNRSSSPFDIRAFFWRELSARAQHILLDVHELARAYGWRESDVLSLSPTRRRRYLELIDESGPLDPVRHEDLETVVERAPVALVEPREPHSDEHASVSSANQPAAPESADIPQPSSRGRNETVESRAQEHSRQHDAVRSMSDGVRRGLAAWPARIVAAVSRRESDRAIPVMPAMPQVTVNIARIDVVATPAQAATSAVRAKRHEPGLPLSTYLARRESEAR